MTSSSSSTTTAAMETYVLHVTKKCNLECCYCYEQDKTSEYEWEDIKALLDDMVKYNPNFILEFLGGEPCLRIDLIEQTINYLEEELPSKTDSVNVNAYYITTNGTVINETLISLLKKYPYKIRWIASIDGNKFMNSLRIFKNSNKNSYDKVIENFQILRDKLDGDPYQQLGCHIVTHPYNIGYFNEGIDDLYKKGFRHFGIGTVESTMKIDEIYCNRFIFELKKLSDRIKKGDHFTDGKIYVDILEGLKPKSDERHYIRDEKTGKVILETYGRASNDIKDQSKYKTQPSYSNYGDMIYDIRETVYLYHQKEKKEADNAQK